MNYEKPIAALFDFDGVIMDTEPQYTLFWDAIGQVYYPEIPNFGHHIKGQSLKELYKNYFGEVEGLQDHITQKLLEFEGQMHFEYIAGAAEFIRELRERGVRLAIVTSSNDAKMANAYREHPEILSMVDAIITADRVTHSKPHPECFLLGAETLNVPVENCIVFEDSFHGIEAGNRAGMKVIGLATTNPAEAIAEKVNLTIPDFVDFSFEKMTSVLQ